MYIFYICIVKRESGKPLGKALGANQTVKSPTLPQNKGDTHEDEIRFDDHARGHG